MMTNYELQQIFLDHIKEFAISNPYREIDLNFIYSNLIRFNIKSEQMPGVPIMQNFRKWRSRYENNLKIETFLEDSKSFLWFFQGKIKGNEIKLYIPMDYNHINEGANQLFDFISSTEIQHKSKIATIIRNDNIVIRVNSLDDAKIIMDYVNNNKYIQEGLIKINPFLPNSNGIGITMDNNYSYNATVCSIISDFLNYLKQNNRLDLFNVVELNKYIKSNIENINDPDLKDIYTILSKTTTPDFKIDDFVNYANNKLADKYDEERKRIISPKFYFEQAIKITNKVHPQNSKEAIIQYLKGNPNYFTNQEKARAGLIKYVNPGDVINLMRTKLKENNIEIPNTDDELVENYLKILEKEIKNEKSKIFDRIKSAYVITEYKHDKAQARYALKELFLNNSVKCFTNKYGCREELNKIIFDMDIKSVILSNIDITNLDINNIDEIINRFEKCLSHNKNLEKKH